MLMIKVSYKLRRRRRRNRANGSFLFLFCYMRPFGIVDLDFQWWMSVDSRGQIRKGRIPPKEQIYLKGRKANGE